jgi:hypothetical protein
LENLAIRQQLSRHRVRPGRKHLSRKLRRLIFRMVAEKPTWDASRTHGELTLLGLDVSERTVLRWMRRASRSPELAKRWATFLSNHREAIAAIDFFTLPTLTFGAVYCFFVISHDRRRILHWEVTHHPNWSCLPFPSNGSERSFPRPEILPNAALEYAISTRIAPG